MKGAGLLAALPVVLLLGCGGEPTETATARAITSGWDGYVDRFVELEGVHVRRNSNVLYASTRLDYITLEDATGRLNIWYERGQWRCPPRIGARLTVQGKVVATGQEVSHVFIAKSMDIHDQPQLADNEVRMCQLSLNEQQIYATEGQERLEQYWRESGKQERVLVYD